MDKIKWIWLAILFIGIGCKSVPADNVVNDNEMNMANDAEALNFPQNWEGRYIGMLQIFKAGQSKAARKIEMELIIKQISLDSNRYEWQIIYGTDKVKGLREYELIVKNRDKGLYIIDERNSILLDAFLVNGKLISRFSVAGNLITATYEKEGDYIHFEILSGKEKVDAYTGGKEAIPEVGNYSIAVRQTARLKKVIEENMGEK